MAIFKCNWIILKKSILNDKTKLITVFTDEYWKININYKDKKTDKQLDIWYIINFETKVKDDNKVTQLNNVYIKSVFNYENKSYSIIFEYLNLIKIVQKKCPLNLQIYWIYDIFSKMQILENLSEEKIIFCQLKILFKLWLISNEHKNEKINKILKFIEKNNISEIVKLKWLDDNSKSILKELIKAI